MKATMTKAKQFIQNHKRDYSNDNVGWNDNGEVVTWYSPWLSPDDALRAVEIEREEMIEKACEWLKDNITYIHPRKGTEECIINLTIFKNYMKGE